jgi:acetolactate synthase-1/2/3 large subunit
MESLQRIVVEPTMVPVMSEAGNAFIWTTHALRFDQPGRYRTSMRFGSMGHVAAGVVGVALARSGAALAVVGDGSMLMSNEVSTAATLGAHAIWIVLNDGRYGLVADGMEELGYAPFGLDFHPADFATMARALGATGSTVRREAELDAALARALAHEGPTVVDVHIDRSERAPFGARNRSLADQGASGRGRSAAR